VSTDPAVSSARRYLLGQSGEEECAAIEREYFADATALDRITAVEDDLVEDYLAGRLAGDERDGFEKHYLASAPHRTRVETIRRLIAMPADGPLLVRRSSFRYLAIAATLLMAVGVLWRVVPRPPEHSGASEHSGAREHSGAPERPAASAQPDQRVFAVSLSPIAVRSAENRPAVVIPAGIDVLALQLEGDTGSARATNARAVIQTVAGDAIWQGSASSTPDLPAGVIARFDVPASRLGVDDYIVVLLESDAGNAERERNRYVLRLRSH
jgi:hypothetical protein